MPDPGGSGSGVEGSSTPEASKEKPLLVVTVSGTKAENLNPPGEEGEVGTTGMSKPEMSKLNPSPVAFVGVAGSVVVAVVVAVVVGVVVVVAVVVGVVVGVAVVLALVALVTEGGVGGVIG